MTVKEGEQQRQYGPFKMDKLCPALASNYYENLINDKGNESFVQAWDLMMGSHNLAATIASLKKALDKKNGIEEIDCDSKDLYHMQIDS